MFTITKAQPKHGIWHAEHEDSPGPKPGEVKIRVHKAGICGTDYHIYVWDAWSSSRVGTPMTIGHEFMGEVVALGAGVKHLALGQRVSAECHVTCGHCHQCRTGNAHLCAETRIIGVNRPGCFAETITVPAGNVWPVDDRIPDHHAAIFDPAGNAMHAVTTAGVTGRDVLITGAGAIGLISVAIARAQGAKSVVVHEPAEYRAGLAQKLGADLVLDSRDADTHARSLDVTVGRGFDAILEMSGKESALQSAFALARPGADISLLGLPGGPVSLNLAEDVIMKGLVLHGITGRRLYETWYQVEAFMLQCPEALDAIITHVLPAADYAAGFALMDRGACGKVVLDFTQLQAKAA